LLTLPRRLQSYAVVEAGDWEWFDRAATLLAYPDPAGLRARLAAEA